MEMQSYINHISISDIYALIENVEAKFGVKYATLQKEALIEAISGSLLILTGGPGTGKTTVVKGLISIFSSIAVADQSSLT